MDPASRRNFGSSYYPKINVVRVSLPEENDSIWKPKKCQARHEETPFHQSLVTSLAKENSAFETWLRFLLQYWPYWILLLFPFVAYRVPAGLNSTLPLYIEVVTLK